MQSHIIYEPLRWVNKKSLALILWKQGLFSMAERRRDENRIPVNFYFHMDCKYMSLHIDQLANSILINYAHTGTI